MNARHLAALALLLAVTGCVDNSASVRLFGLCFPPTPSESGACSFPAKCDALMIGALEFDPANASPAGALIWPVQVDNQRDPTTDASAGRSDTATAWVTGYEITYQGALSGSRSVAAPEASPVLPNGNTVVLVPIIPPGVGAAVPAGGVVGAEIKAKGHYGDGSFFETGALPVQATAGVVTYGCPATTPTLVGVCPQAGQTAVPLCK
jgi:hypothetical protein